MMRLGPYAWVAALLVSSALPSHSMAAKPGAGNVSVTATFRDDSADKVKSDGGPYDAFIDVEGDLSFDRTKLGVRTMNLDFGGEEKSPPTNPSCLWNTFPTAAPTIVEVALTVEGQLSAPCPDSPSQTCKGMLAMAPGGEIDARFKIVFDDPEGRRRICNNRFTRYTVRFSGDENFPGSTKVRVIREDLDRWKISAVHSEDPSLARDWATLVLGNVPGIDLGTYGVPFEMLVER